MSEIMTVATKTVAVSSSALLNPGLFIQICQQPLYRLMKQSSQFSTVICLNGILGFLAFYRVNYDSELWSAIQKRLENEPEKYGIVQRAQLVADFCYFNSKGLVRNGETLRKKFIQMVYRRLVFSITLDTQEIGPFPTFFSESQTQKGFSLY